MLELGQILGVLSAVLLLVAGAAWVKRDRAPELQPIGRPPQAPRAPTELASQLLALAFCLSAVAAVLTVVAHIGL